MPWPRSDFVVAPVTSLPRSETLPPAIASTPKTARMTSDLPEPTSPPTPTISPALPPRARREAHLGKRIRDDAPGHQPHQLVVAGGLGVERRDVTAVAQHRDAVA